MMKLKKISALLSIALMAFSCENELPDDIPCKCHNGGQIGGWEDNDSIENQEIKDTTGTFEVILEQWGDTIHKNINL